jgi:hypothetical protein
MCQHPRLRCVVLDPYDLNTIDNREHTPTHERGYRWLSQYNKTDLRGRGTVSGLHHNIGSQWVQTPRHGDPITVLAVPRPALMTTTMPCPWEGGREGPGRAVHAALPHHLASSDAC